MINEGQSADDQIPDRMLFQHVQYVFEVLNRIHASILEHIHAERSMGFPHFRDVFADGDQCGKALLGCLTLPERQIPGFGILERFGPISNDACFSFGGSFANSHGKFLS